MDDRRIFIGTDIPKGHIYAFNKANGRAEWKYFAGAGVRGHILGGQDRVFALTKKDRLVCLDKEEGMVVWSFKTDVETTDFNNHSPCLSGNRIYFGGLDHALYALDVSTGDILWQKKLPAHISTSVSEWEGSIYAATEKGTVYRLDHKDGRIEKTFQLKTKPYGDLTFAENHLLVLVGRGGKGPKLLSLDAGLNKIEWTAESGKGAEWLTYHPHIWEDLVLMGDSKGHVTAFHVADGGVAWSFRVEGQIRAIGRASNRIFIGSKEGMLYAYQVER